MAKAAPDTPLVCVLRNAPGLNAPALTSPVLTAFAYAVLPGPMTVPCAGPLIVRAFVLGTGSIASLADGLLCTLALALASGRPLLLLPSMADSAQCHLSRWPVGRYGLLSPAAGLILVRIGAFGAWAEIPPSL